MRVLVVNAGSSSLKLSLLNSHDDVLAVRELPPPQEVEPTQMRELLQAEFSDAEAVGHRIVHGGERFHGAALIDADVRRELAELVGLAPLHQPGSLAALDLASAALPEKPAVACFDTAFHATMPAGASTYAIPGTWRARWPIRRYGFHGLSHAWVGRRAAEMLDVPHGTLRIVSCHLGAGASVCAIENGRSVDTTMGFTPLEGLVMATRSGSVDPGLLLWLLQQPELSLGEVEHALEHESGLLALGGSADMRVILERQAAGDHNASTALEVYLHRLRGAIAEMAAALGGIEVLAFTGGVGERSSQVRSAAINPLRFLGLALDDAKNVGYQDDADISDPQARIRTLVIHAREDVEIARQTRELIAAGEGPY